MNRILSALLLALCATLARAEAPASPLQIADDAPARYVVAPGDTLWGISARFLKEPWRWPEIWGMDSTQEKQPHKLRPGDVIVLDRNVGGRPLLRLADGNKLSPKIYSEDVAETIPSIPPNVIEPFISRPLVVDDPTVQNGARIVGLQEERITLSPGDKAFVTGAEDKPDHPLWQIYRPGSPLKDPESGEILGYEAFYIGTAVQERPGNPAEFEIRTVRQEAWRGDRLLPSLRPQLVNYAPHKPDHAVVARIVSIYGGVGTAGRGSVVAINRGSNTGLEVGHVLALYRKRAETFRNLDTDKKETWDLPPERYGLVFVFRVFERISYALVLNSSRPLDVNDTLQTP